MKDLYINDRITLPASQLEVRQVRSSGPGGQNVNKVATKVILAWKIDPAVLGGEGVESRLRRLAGQRVSNEGELQIACQESRSAERNQQLAVQRLRQLILKACEKPKIRRPTRPTRGSNQRRLDAKAIRSQKKQSRQGDW